jgi:hypothetical protein
MAASARWVLAGATAVVVLGFLLWSPEPDYSAIEVVSASDLERELDALRERLNIPG